jgi:hypothetical protein
MKFKLFVDLDGVLVDFDKGVEEATGRLPGKQAPGRMWAIIARTPEFYAGLDWMPDGRELWDRVLPLQPTILTGLPRGKWAEPQKREWCNRELGEEIEVITCMSREKAQKAAEFLTDGETPILIDDRESIAEAWQEMGGIFIHHRSAADSIKQLEIQIQKGDDPE